MRTLLLLSSQYICSVASSLLLLELIPMDLVNFLYFCDTLEHIKRKPLKSCSGMPKRKLTLHIYLFTYLSEKLILHFDSSVAAIGMDLPQKLQPGPADTYPSHQVCDVYSQMTAAIM